MFGDFCVVEPLVIVSLLFQVKRATIEVETNDIASCLYYRLDRNMFRDRTAIENRIAS